MNEITKKIFKLLEDHKIPYETFEHEIAMTCEEASRARNMPLKYGGKSLLFKDKRGFKLFTLPAHKKAINKKIRKILSSQKLRFATHEELKDLAGVKSGALPPISKGLYEFDHYVDKSLLENDKIVFNAGVLTITIILKMKDYLKLIDASFCEFCD